MLEIENFSLSYGEGEPVLKEISLSLKAGKCLVVTGESGSGTHERAIINITRFMEKVNEKK